jgi:hypothetical protein
MAQLEDADECQSLLRADGEARAGLPAPERRTPNAERRTPNKSNVLSSMDPLFLRPAEPVRGLVALAN